MKADSRLRVSLVMLVIVALLGSVVKWLPSTQSMGSSQGPAEASQLVPTPSIEKAVPRSPKSTVSPPEREQVAQPKFSELPQTSLRQHFQKAVVALKQGRYRQAVDAWYAILALAPGLPEAHVNMGFALLGLNHPRVAIDFFNNAIDLRANQVNAYFGLAIALEQLDDLPGAMGAMRSYIHLTQADDPLLPKARAALWEWGAKLTTATVTAPPTGSPQ